MWFNRWKEFADLLNVTDPLMSIERVIDNHFLAIESLFLLVFTKISLRELREGVDDKLPNREKLGKIGEVSGVMQALLCKEINKNAKILVVSPTWDFTKDLNLEMQLDA